MRDSRRSPLPKCSFQNRLYPIKDKRKDGSRDPKNNASGATCRCECVLAFDLLSSYCSQYKKRYELNEIPVPTVGDNDLLIKSGAAGFCHTE